MTSPFWILERRKESQDGGRVARWRIGGFQETKHLMVVKGEERDATGRGSSLKNGDMISKWLAPKVRKEV